jgi:hypothetical protein
VRALTRRAGVVGASALSCAGSEEAGRSSCGEPVGWHLLVLNQARNAKGDWSGRAAGGWTDEKAGGGWCEKQVKFDPDLWIAEIEDREGRTFVDEPGYSGTRLPPGLP